MCLAKSNDGSALFVGSFLLPREDGGAIREGICWRSSGSPANPDWRMLGRWMGASSGNRIVWWLESVRIPLGEDFAGVVSASLSAGVLPERLKGEVTAGETTAGTLQVVRHLSGDWQVMSRLPEFRAWVAEREKPA